MDAGGDHATTLPYPNGGMSWSPDGSKFAASEGGTISVFDADGSHQVTVYTPPSGKHAFQPRWLPDGSAIAFLQQNSLGGAQIWTVRPDGTGAAQVPAPAPTSTFGYIGYDVLPGGGYLLEQYFSTYSTISVWHPGDAALRQVAQGLLTQFAAAPDGRSFAVLSGTPQSSGSVVVDLVDIAGGQSTQIASGTEIAYLVWSPDGTRLAYPVVDATSSSGPTETHVAVRDMRTGTVTAAVAPAPNVLDLPMAWRPVPTPVQEDRVGGADRIGTAIATSQLGFAATGADGRQAQAAVLTRSDTFADALAGSALAADKHGPLLLTGTAGLDPAVARELKRVLPPHAKVYLLGGVNALSDQVAQQVAALGFTPSRVAGPDRDATAVAIAQQITATPHTFLVATGRNFPDALAAGAVAGAIPNAVVLLSDDNTLSATTKNYLTAHHHSGDTLLGVGNQGSNALASAVPSATITSQFRGYDRFDTAAKLANHFYSGASKPSTIGVATAANWPDALGGGALLGAHPGPLLLTGPGTNGLSAGETAYLTANSAAVEEIVVFGGHSVVPPPVAAAVADTVTVTDNWGYGENRVAPGLP
ncbi:cell wall-binding repeat-containing protein [Catenulispora sp. EB89]|uniref:cell wall-binding repeat-containing protein n=1 Tax=Catenulispora sp. EB89 TaxID=3156257 RepID=UPI003513C973